VAKSETKTADLQQSVEIPRRSRCCPSGHRGVPSMVLRCSWARDVHQGDRGRPGREPDDLPVLQKDINVENPAPSDLYSIGTVGVIMRMLKLPDGRIKILVQGVSRRRPPSSCRRSRSTRRDQDLSRRAGAGDPRDRSAHAQREGADREAGLLRQGDPPDIMVVIENVDDPGKLADLAVANMGLKVSRPRRSSRSPIPSCGSSGSTSCSARRSSSCPCSRRSSRTSGRDRQDPARVLPARADEGHPARAGRHRRPGRGHPRAPRKDQAAKMPRRRTRRREAAPQARAHASRRGRGLDDADYIEWLTELPWSKATKDNLDLKAAHRILEEDHYDLEKVKERIIEYLAVRKLKEKMKGRSCASWDPGRGQNVPRQVHRAQPGTGVRAHLAGRVRDEAEIRGHRRTYVGALPGRSSRASRPPVPTIRSSCWTRSTSSAPISAAIRRRRSSRCWTRSRTTRSATTTSGSPSTCRT